MAKRREKQLLAASFGAFAAHVAAAAKKKVQASAFSKSAILGGALDAFKQYSRLKKQDTWAAKGELLGQENGDWRIGTPLQGRQQTQRQHRSECTLEHLLSSPCCLLSAC